MKAAVSTPTGPAPRSSISATPPVRSRRARRRRRRATAPCRGRAARGSRGRRVARAPGRCLTLRVAIGPGSRPHSSSRAHPSAATVDRGVGPRLLRRANPPLAKTAPTPCFNPEADIAFNAFRLRINNLGSPTNCIARDGPVHSPAVGHRKATASLLQISLALGGNRCAGAFDCSGVRGLPAWRCILAVSQARP
jgi:hypothetical protein